MQFCILINFEPTESRVGHEKTCVKVKRGKCTALREGDPALPDRKPHASEGHSHGCFARPLCARKSVMKF